MPLFSNEVVSVLWFLLPGFVAAWIFLGLTRHPKLSEFEQVVQALIFTAFAQGAVIIIEWIAFTIGRSYSLGMWTDNVKLVWSVGVAVAIGVVFAWLANHDVWHSLFRVLRITKQSGYPSEWVRAFAKRGRTFVVLHLSGERRLMGWVEEWPVEPPKGHLSVEKARWVTDDTSIPLKGVSHILVPASEVTFVEFMDRPSSDSDRANLEGTDHERGTEGATANTAPTTPGVVPGSTRRSDG